VGQVPDWRDAGGVQAAQRLPEGPGARWRRQHDPTGPVRWSPACRAAPTLCSAASVRGRSAAGIRSSTTASPRRSLSWSLVPSLTRRPWSMTAIRLASRSASSRYWVVSSTVVPVPTRSWISSHRSSRQPVQTAHHLEVLASSEELVDRGGLARQPDPGAHAGRVLEDVDTRARCPHRAAAGSPARGPAWSYRRRWAQQPVDAAARHREREAVQRADPAVELLDQTLDLDDRVHRCSLPSMRAGPSGCGADRIRATCLPRLVY
jgi:hypothetical protein